MELRYRPEIDGLRTIAVLSVILYHAEFALGSGNWLPGGFLGVDIFFVISGYLITSLLISEHHRTGKFSIAHFYERRARRLLPALLTVMLVSIPFGWWILLPEQLIDFAWSLLASLFFASNFYWLTTLQEYGAESALLKPFLHTWTLAVEEQFYIIYPLLLLGLYRWVRAHVLMLLTAGLLLSLQFAEWYSQANPSFSFYMLPSRFWQLLAGGVLAHVATMRPRPGGEELLARIMPVVGLALILHAMVFTKFSANHPGLVTLLPVAGTLLIIWFANENELVTRILASRPFVGVGLISYSLYLWHYPIFAFGRLYDQSPSVPMRWGWILLTFVLSIITYFLIEKPFRNRQRTSRLALVAAVLAGSALVVMFSAYSIHGQGFRDRHAGLIEIYQNNVYDNATLRRESWSLLAQAAERAGARNRDQWEQDMLAFGNQPERTRLLLVGNSHSKDIYNAITLNPGLFSDLEVARYGIQIGASEEDIDTLLASPNFIAADMVLVTSRYEPLKDDDHDRVVADIDGLAPFLRRIMDEGKGVAVTSNRVEFLVMDDQPLFDWYVQRKNGEAEFSHDELGRLFYDNRNLERTHPINTRIKEIAGRLGVPYLEGSPYICDQLRQTCDGVTPDGYKAFYDTAHFTLEGAHYFGQRMHALGWLGAVRGPPDPK